MQLKAVFPHGAGFVLAFEFMLSDLAEVVRHTQRPLAQAQVKSYLQMLLKGVAFCHANNIVHRVSATMGWGGPVDGWAGSRPALDKGHGQKGQGLGTSDWGCGPGGDWVLSSPGCPAHQALLCQGPLGVLEGLMLLLVPSGPETSQPAYQCLRPAQDSGLWPGPGLFPRQQPPLHAPGGYQVGRTSFWAGYGKG